MRFFSSVTALFLLILLSGTVQATNYYYNQSGGNDANNCSTTALSCKTIVDLNTKAVAHGDNVYFAKGEVWRLPTDAYPVFVSGTSAGDITYTSYGTGDKPLFLGSYNLSGTGNWENVAGNVWRTIATYSLDIGNLIFNDGTSNGVKYSTYASLNAQGRFLKNETDENVYMYSVGNPGSYYTNIEGAYKTVMFSIGSRDYITIDGLDFRYGGSHAIEASTGTNKITIKNNNFYYVGGAYQTGTLRYGNCVELGLSASNILVTRNNASRCYDACYSTQSWLSGGVTTISNHTYSYNLGTRCSYGFEYFSSDTSSTVEDVTVHHNTFVHLGTNGFGANTGRIRMDRTPPATTNFTFYDNIVYNTTFKLIDFSDAQDWYGDYEEDYNLLYLNTGANFIQWNGTNYNSLAAFTAATGQEANGVEADPAFVAGSYVPEAGSVACTMSSTGGYVGAFPCAEDEPETVSCKSHRSVCTPWTCLYAGLTCSESSVVRPLTIVCTVSGCV